MPSQVAAILDNVVTVLRQSGRFNVVTLGQRPASNIVPRAYIVFEGLDCLTTDDSCQLLARRLRCRLCIHTRLADPSQRTARLTELCQAAVEALLADQFRGGLCRHLPGGAASELDHIQPVEHVRSPEAEATISLRCHFHAEEEGE